MKEYVEMRNGGYYVKGKRVSLDTLVALFHAGYPPNLLHYNFPSLTLEEIYGALTFYLANREQVDESIRRIAEEFDRRVPPLSESDPELYARLMKAKEEMAAKLR